MSPSGIGSGIYASVSATSNATIIKDGNAINGSYSEALNGDTFALQVMSLLGFGKATSASLSVGSSSSTWNITTRMPTLQYLSPAGCGPAGYPGDNAALYHAFPILPAATFIAKYIGTAMNLSGNTSPQISIYSDSGSASPLSPLVSSNTGNAFFSGVSLTLAGGGSFSATGVGYGFYLGSQGQQLQANTKYWVVVRFSTAADPGSSDQGNLPFGSRLVSSDGTTWTVYNGQASCRYGGGMGAQMPRVYITD